MDCRQLRFFLFSPPTPSSQIWTNITWFFNIYANKSQQVISWSVLTEFIWSCTAAHFESKGIKHKIILATCSCNCKRIRKLTRGLEVALWDQKQTESTSGNAFKNVEVTLGAFDFQLELRKVFHLWLFCGKDYKFAGTLIPLEFVSAWLNFSVLVVVTCMLYLDNYLLP